jgi:DNA adenine methylase
MSLVKMFIFFLDSPYYSATKSRLYGKNGNLHINFDHEKFAKNIKQCSHKWLITYDDSPKIRERFKFARIHRFKLQYGVHNKAVKGKGLIITNYELPSDLIQN